METPPSKDEDSKPTGTVSTVPRVHSRKPMKRTRSAPDWKHAGCTKLKIGICAMDKKARSKPMKEIVARLLAFGEFEVFYFGDKVILEETVDAWPLCDAMLSWHSDGFPLKKAQQYAVLRKPFLVNDVVLQDALLDRRRVYKILMDSSIPVPRHIVVNRDSAADHAADPPGFVEGEDYVEMDGVRIDKPFVEKPASGEDHSIYIYYPHSMGGGVKRLFRKVDDKSADYDPKHPGTVRRDGSYIYEEFLTTGGTDVKVYTVGPRYAHAEARKSPVVDGKVNRTADGKEVRFPVLLSPQEKEIARMVCLAFGQRVCGFDLLRSEKGRSYVCDVNGWSFVKNSKKYYDDTAGIVRSMILSQLAPHRLAAQPDPALWSFSLEEEDDDDEGCGNATAGATGMKEVGSLQDISLADGMMDDDGADDVSTASDPSRYLELRCVLAVVRHGDRTPKQKMKMTVSQPLLLELFHKYKDSKGKQAKLKSPSQLQDLLDVTRQLLAGLEKRDRDDVNNGGSVAPGTTEEEKDNMEEAREKLRIVRTVLEQGGQFSGINRKVQLKPLKWGRANTADNSSDPDSTAAAGGSNKAREAGGAAASSHLKPYSGGGTAPDQPVVKELLLILKYGGVLTHAGRQQAEDLGQSFRMVMYPRYGPAGGGLLRLHSTYRHDLKIYSSDEGRVQMSAAAFTKGLLDLEGNSLTPILVSLVKKDASMLDAFGKGASEDILAAKNTLYQYLTWDPDKALSLCSKLAPPLATPASTSPPMSPRASDGQSTGLPSPFMMSSTPRPSQLSLSASMEHVHMNGMNSPMSARHRDGPLLPASVSSASLFAMSSSVGSQHDMRKVTSTSSLQAMGSLGMMSVKSVQEARSAAVAGIRAMPDKPLELLYKLVSLMKIVVDQLREKCLEERIDHRDHGAGSVGSYSSLSQAPEEWTLEEGKPCSGERLLLMFDRWRKLLKSFYHEKKQQFDISKIPDIYDSAKYDSIHNGHLHIHQLKDLYDAAHALAAVVVPHEYGLDPHGKLRIGAKICNELLGKLLRDLESMQEESLATTAIEMEAAAAREHDGSVRSNRGSHCYDAFDAEFGEMSIKDDRMKPWSARQQAAASLFQEYRRSGGTGAEGRSKDGDSEEPEEETLHRLCPTYASDVNSPMRHVRTRIYFTSESHIHSLVNVLRYCHLGVAPNSTRVSAAGGLPTSPQPSMGHSQQVKTVEAAAAALASTATNGGDAAVTAAVAVSSTEVSGVASDSTSPQRRSSLAAGTRQSSTAGAARQSSMNNRGSSSAPLLSPEGQALLDNTDEFDYLTHIVFRMYENKQVPIDAPERFLVEVLFSNGTNHDPTAVTPLHDNHTLPVVPRQTMHMGNGIPLQRLDDLLDPYAVQRKLPPSAYALHVALRAPFSQSTSVISSRTQSGSLGLGTPVSMASAPLPLPPVETKLSAVLSPMMEVEQAEAEEA